MPGRSITSRAAKVEIARGSASGGDRGDDLRAAVAAGPWDPSSFREWPVWKNDLYLLAQRLFKAEK